MKSKHNRNLDILRGVAALVVVCFHLISCYPRAFDTKYELGHLLNYNFPGHMSVLVFFILSGYVISINTKPLTDRKSILSYIKKRLIRIVPIYFIAILFTVAITWGAYDWRVVLCNFFFVSVPFDNVIIENGPLWSLNYELIYYFLFILFSYFRISFNITVKVLAAVIALLFAFFHNVKIYPLYISYLIGFLFWATGAMIAEQQERPVWNIRGSRVIAIFILIFCLQSFNPYGPVLKVLKLNVADYTALSMYQQSISWPDLYYFPLAILLIFSLTHMYSKKCNYLLYFLYISAMVRLVMIYKVYDINFIVSEHYVVPAVIFIASILLWLFNFEIGDKIKEKMKYFSSFGSVSYAVYIIHLPLIYFFGNMPATSGVFFAIKVVGYLAALLLIAYLLELKYQPFIKKQFYKKPKAISNPAG